MDERREHPTFSLNEFKNWMAQQDDLSKFFDIGDGDAWCQLVGSQVRAKVGRKKLAQRIECDRDGSVDDLVDELVEGGGVVVGIDGKNLVVEVESGTFRIPRFCVRID